MTSDSAVAEVEAVRPASPDWPRRAEFAAVAVLTASACAFYLVYSVSRYTTYLSAGYDLGIFDQAVRAYAHFQAPIVPLKGAGYNVLGDHFHPIIAVIAPLYWIWDNACVLLIVQSVLIASSIPIVYRFARRRTNPYVSWVVAGAYAIGWAFQSMIDFDFHEVAFAIPLLALAIDALDRRADRQLLICAALLLLVREDMGALLVMIGIIRMLAPRGRPYWPGASLILGGLLAYGVAVAVIIPAFSQDGRFDYWSYQELGPNLPSAVGNIVIHPWHAVRVFFTPWEKRQTLLYLFLPLLFLPLRSRYALIALPLLAERFFNTRDLLWSTHYHYNAPIWTILVLAMIDGAARLRVFTLRPAKYVLVAWLIFVPFWITEYGKVTPDVVPRMLSGRVFDLNAHSRAQAALTALIPADTCVAVDDRLAPHLTRRNYVTLADAQYGTADFVAVDLAFHDVGNFGPSPLYVLDVARRYGYTGIFAQDGLLLLKSPSYHGPSAGCHPTGSGK